MMPPLEIHFFLFFSYSQNANDDVDKLNRGKKTNNIDYSKAADSIVENSCKKCSSLGGNGIVDLLTGKQ